MKNLLLICCFLFLLNNNANSQLFEQKDSELFEQKQTDIRGTGGESPGGGNGGEVTPIGSGLLVLTGLSLGYAWFKQSRKEDD